MTPTFEADNARTDDELHAFHAAARSGKRDASESSFSALALLAAFLLAIWALFTVWHWLPTRRRERRDAARVVPAASKPEADAVVAPPASESAGAL